jgi:hypothetical protein
MAGRSDMDTTRCPGCGLELTTDTVVREYFRDRATYLGVSGIETRLLHHHGGKESRTTV